MIQANTALRREVMDNKALNAVIGVAFFILAMALGAYVRIPVPGSPVPITLQTFFVLLSGAVLGKKLGASSQAGYVALGALGAPLFQGASYGIPYLLGPTGGYLAGFIVAGALVGRMAAPKEATFRRIVISFIIGDAIIHLLGSSWLIAAYRFDLTRAVSIGILPFIPGELIKITLAASTYRVLRQRAREIFN